MDKSHNIPPAHIGYDLLAKPTRDRSTEKVDRSNVALLNLNAQQWAQAIEPESPDLKKTHLLFLQLRDFHKSFEDIIFNFRYEQPLFCNLYQDITLSEEDQPEKVAQYMLMMHAYFNSFQLHFKGLIDRMEAAHLDDAPDFMAFNNRLEQTANNINGSDLTPWDTERIKATDLDQVAYLIFGEVSLMLNELNWWLMDLEEKHATKRNAEIRRIVANNEAMHQKIDQLRTHRKGLVILLLAGLVLIPLDPCSSETSSSAATIATTTAQKPDANEAEIPSKTAKTAEHSKSGKIIQKKPSINPPKAQQNLTNAELLDQQACKLQRMKCD